MAKLWAKHSNPALHVHRLVGECLQASVEMEKILDENKQYYALPGVHFRYLSVQMNIATYIEFEFAADLL